MYLLYRSLTILITPLVPVFLKLRLKSGKEDAVRLPERLGQTSTPRPQGKLVWIHAASVGEAMAALPLVDALLASSAAPYVLLTTVTVTSAALMQQRLPARAIHQFAPVDTPGAVKAFLTHWRPDVALWVDSELWPNLIMQTRKSGAVMGIVNARMSERSFRGWRFARSLVAQLLSCFSFCLAQSDGDMERLNALGMRVVSHIGNLKYDAAPLPYRQEDLMQLKAEIGNRPLWLAASTHPGEEKIIAQAHVTLKKTFPDVLTIIVPRHAQRGDEIASKLSPLKIARRSQRQAITAGIDIYLADTMGELGLFYRLAPVALIGGSLVPHGGQNPLEAARLGPAILAGPHTENFTDIYAGLEKAHAFIKITQEEALAEAVKELLSDRKRTLEFSERARAYVQAQSGQVAHIMNELQPYLASAKT